MIENDVRLTGKRESGQEGVFRWLVSSSHLRFSALILVDMTAHTSNKIVNFSLLHLGECYRQQTAVVCINLCFNKIVLVNFIFEFKVQNRSTGKLDYVIFHLDRHRAFNYLYVNWKKK